MIKVICEYCDTPNKEENEKCISCGAPLNSTKIGRDSDMRPIGSSSAEFLRMLGDVPERLDDLRDIKFYIDGK